MYGYFKLLADDRTRQMLADMNIVIAVSLIAAGLIVAAIFIIMPHLARKITVTRKYREKAKDGTETRIVECKFKKGDQIHTLGCPSQILYDKLSVGHSCNVVIKNDNIVKISKVTGKRSKWRIKK